MLWPKKDSYKVFDNEKKFLRLENSPPPPPITFPNGRSLSWRSPGDVRGLLSSRLSCTSLDCHHVTPNYQKYFRGTQRQFSENICSEDLEFSEHLL